MVAGRLVSAAKDLRRVFLLATLVLLVALLVVFAVLRGQNNARQWVIHSRQVLQHIDLTLSSVKDAETGQRGYLLTGDGRGEPAAAAELVRWGGGASIMDKLRAHLANMRAEEERLLTLRSARTSRAEDWTLATVSLLFGLALFLLWLLRALTVRVGARVRLSEQRLATILASVGDAVLATNEHGRIERMNLVAEQLTGWSLAEAQGQSLETVFHIVSERTRDRVESPFAKVLREGQVFTDVMMPGSMNGMDLAREVRRRWPNVRVLITTGYAGSSLKGAEAEVAVLSKPYEMKTLDTALSAALGKSA